ncbi:MAG: DUF5906 domain-containing protein [bacterium]|nr:DUF5906 domain-containing protein [bacterium]
MLKAYYTTVEYLKNNTGKLTSEQKGTAMSMVGTKTHPLQPIHVDWTQINLDKFFNGPIGYSPHEFEGGIRNKKNYLRTNFVLIDIDNGMPADDFIKVLEGHPFHPQYYINFSANSQPEYEKYHVIMPLDAPIDGISQHRLLADWLLQDFGQHKPDLSVINDCARGVLRGNAAFPSRMGGTSPLPTKIILDSQRQQKTIEHLQKQGSVIDGKVMYVSLQDEVQLDGPEGDWALLSDLDPKDKPRILCHVCGHRQDLRQGTAQNAVYMLNQHNVPFIFCSSCQSRGWGIGGKGVYNLEPDEARSYVEGENDFRIYRDVRDNKFKMIRHDVVFGGRIISTITWDGIHNWYGELGVDAPNTFPNMDFVMDFGCDDLVDEKKHVVNLYQAPAVLKAETKEQLYDIPFFTGHLIRHITGDDPECMDRFLDWLAYIVQNRRKLCTTWLLQGTQGTGKGLFFNHVLAPLFGKTYCMMQDMKSILSNFNGNLEDKVFIGLDEVQADFTDIDRNVIEARIKHWLGEEHIRIERKGVDARMARTCTNFLFFSNKRNAVQLEEGDRRFNICPRQEAKLETRSWLPNGGIDELIQLLEKEVAEFVQFLKQRDVDVRHVFSPMENQAKRDMMAVTQSVHDLFFQKVRELDWDWFEEHINGSCDDKRRPAADRAIACLVEERGGNCITFGTIFALYNNIVHEGPTDISKSRFSKKLTYHGFKMETLKVRGQSVKGYRP